MPPMTSRGANVHRGERTQQLRSNISRGGGEWACVPLCVRQAIAELLDQQQSASKSSTSATVRSSTTSTNRIRTPHNDSTMRTAVPSSQRTSQGPTSGARPVAPLAHLDDDAFLMSVRSFEDAEALRHHAVRNAALFHNNVEQMFRDLRLLLIPELRAAIQLHPLVICELRSLGVGPFPMSVPASVAKRVDFEDRLLTEMIDALESLRTASVRFTANFFSDSEKVQLGIDPHVLPRDNHFPETLSNISSATVSLLDRHSLIIDTEPSHLRSTDRSAQSHVREKTSFAQEYSIHKEDSDRSPRRYRAPMEVVAQLSAHVDSLDRSYNEEAVPENEEPPGDRSPRRQRAYENSRGDPALNCSATDDDNEPHVRPEADTTPSRTLNMEVAMEEVGYAPPPPLSATLPTRSEQRKYLPPTSPTMFVVNQHIQSEPLHDVDLSPRSPLDGPYNVSRPATPKERNDFLIRTPRSISVSKKTQLVPRGSSMDRSSVLTSPRSPSNSMRSSTKSRRVAFTTAGQQ